MRLKRLAFAAATGLAMAAHNATPAQALLIDFTDYSVWGAGNIIATPNLDNQTATASYTYPDNLTVTLTATGGNLTFNVPGSCGSATYLACDGDGIGISDDEISGVLSAGESLLVEFSRAIGIYSISLLDLFGHAGDPESAQLQFDGNGNSTSYSVAGTADADGVGQYQIAMANLAHHGDLTSILFTSPNETSDFALAALELGIDVDTLSIPEPMTVALFGLGLLSLATVMRLQPAPLVRTHRRRQR